MALPRRRPRCAVINSETGESRMAARRQPACAAGAHWSFTTLRCSLTWTAPRFGTVACKGRVRGERRGSRCLALRAAKSTDKTKLKPCMPGRASIAARSEGLECGTGGRVSIKTINPSGPPHRGSSKAPTFVSRFRNRCSLMWGGSNRTVVRIDLVAARQSSRIVYSGENWAAVPEVLEATRLGRSRV
jgi:hypothetical protein